MRARATMALRIALLLGRAALRSPDTTTVVRVAAVYVFGSALLVGVAFSVGFALRVFLTTARLGG